MLTEYYLILILLLFGFLERKKINARQNDQIKPQLIKLSIRLIIHDKLNRKIQRSCFSSFNLQELSSIQLETIVSKDNYLDQDSDTELFTTINPVYNSTLYEDAYGQFKQNITRDIHYLYQLQKFVEHLENVEVEIQHRQKMLWVKQQTLLEQMLDQ
ncbi:Hypothetical_protein [Hexamita inflata]|uniref:Hypothetical_protein n=1 Tax=Hexamita inflata TaxID=28002 RepID=A0ABP1KGZ7_9EUKA